MRRKDIGNEMQSSIHYHRGSTAFIIIVKNETQNYRLRYETLTELIKLSVKGMKVLQNTQTLSGTGKNPQNTVVC